MSKHDFTREEFSARLSQVRAAVKASNLDWLVAFHPVSIHWLTGSDAKSYQEFQCLLIPAREGPLTIVTRAGEVSEFHDDALVDEIVGWGGGVVEDPIAAFDKVARRFCCPSRSACPKSWHRGASLLFTPAPLCPAQDTAGHCLG